MDESKKGLGLIALTEKQPINIDLSRGIVPQTYEELLQFAALYKKSGLAPRSLTDIPQIAIATGMCLELGRPILTGLQDMAVINGRVGIFGDAALGVVRGSSKLDAIKEWSEGKPRTDDWTFYCMISRKGDPLCDSPEIFPQCRECNHKDGCDKVGTWSWLDSKAAGFDNPKQKDGRPDNYSPWRRFTRRMMTFKARNFILRDKFGDVLRGINTVEELQDVVEMTPGAEGGFEVEQTPEEKAEELRDTLNKLGGTNLGGDLDLPPDEANPSGQPEIVEDFFPEEQEEIVEEEVEVPEEEELPVEPGPSEELRKLFINKRKGKDGSGLMKFVIKNGDDIKTWPKKILKELKDKFIGFYGAKAWPRSLDSTPPPEVLVEEEVMEEEAQPKPFLICEKCTADVCGAAFNRTFINNENKRVCLKFKALNPEDQLVQKTNTEKTLEHIHGKKEKDGNEEEKWLRCPKHNNNKKSLTFCKTCFYNEECPTYQDHIAK